MSAPQKTEATSPFYPHHHEAMDIPAEPRLEDENVRCAKRARSCTTQSKLRSQKVCLLDAVEYNASTSHRRSFVKIRQHPSSKMSAKKILRRWWKSTLTIELSKQKANYPSILPHVTIVHLTTVFPLSKIFSRFGWKPRFNLHQNCVTNSIYTRIPMAIVDCEELGWSANCRRIWFSEIRVVRKKLLTLYFFLILWGFDFVYVSLSTHLPFESRISYSKIIYASKPFVCMLGWQWLL